MERKKLTPKKKEAPKDQDATLEQQEKEKDELKDDIQEWISEGGSLGPHLLDEGDEE